LNSYQVQINQIGPLYRAWLTDSIEPMIDGNAPWLKNKDVQYNLNNEFLRCENFKKYENRKNHVMFAGCELSIPIDLNVENGWAYRVHKEFYSENCNFINLSYPGADPAKIIRNIFKYIKKYGVPEKIFVLMPELIRAYGYCPDLTTFKPKMYRQWNNGEEHNKMAVPNNVPIQLLALQYIQSIISLEQYCNDLNIDLCWTTWDKKTNEFLQNYNFNGFFMNDVENYSQDLFYDIFKKQIMDKHDK
jgi:hypothetical protein